MANFKKNDEAVSAVIGVILMVAITVILAAVIAAFVFQLGGNVPKSKSVGVEVKRVTTAGVVGVKTMSGADVGLLGVGALPTTPTYTLMVNGAAATAVAFPSTAAICYDGARLARSVTFPALATMLIVL